MVEARTLGGGVGGRGERENLQKDGFIFPLGLGNQYVLHGTFNYSRDKSGCFKNKKNSRRRIVILR